MKEKKKDENLEEEILESDDINVEEEAIEEVLENEDDFEKKYNEINDSYLRLMADFDNFRKRSIKEKEDTIIYASGKVLEGLLPIIDNFDRALAVENIKDQDLYDGVLMISNQLKEMLLKEGLEKIECSGEKFDPNIHYGVNIENDPDKEDDIILEVFQDGYKYKGKVLRPAMVKVNKH